MNQLYSENSELKSLNPRYLWLFLRFPHSATDSSQTALHFSALLIFKALQKLPSIHPSIHPHITAYPFAQRCKQSYSSFLLPVQVTRMYQGWHIKAKQSQTLLQFGVANEQNLLVFGFPINTLRGHTRCLAQQLDRSDCNSEISLIHLAKHRHSVFKLS